MFKKSLTKMLICDMAGTIIQENGIVYKTLFDSIKKFKPDLKMSQIDDFHGYNKSEVIKHFLYKTKKSSPTFDAPTASIISFLIFLSFNKYLNLSLKKIKTSLTTISFENLRFCSLYRTVE